MNLHALLPQLIPAAVAWAEREAARIAAEGIALPADLQAVARRVGVRAPQRIRVVRADRMPWPDDPLLRRAAMQTGMLGASTIGLTLGYGIVLARDQATTRVVAHECRHVAQYESYGSVAAFLAEYLRQVVVHGYHDAPLEADARAHEIDAP